MFYVKPDKNSRIKSERKVERKLIRANSSWKTNLIAFPIGSFLPLFTDFDLFMLQNMIITFDCLEDKRGFLFENFV